MFTTVEQVKQIVINLLGMTGRGGFITGTISSTNPLKIRINQKLELNENNIYITDSCIGVKGYHSHGGICKIREPLKYGDGVLLICRPVSDEGSKYILLDRIQPYVGERGTNVT